MMGLAENTLAEAIEVARNLDLAEIRKVQEVWATTPLADRLAIVRRFRHLLAESALRLAEISRATTGRPLAETLTAEVLPLADACRFLEREASRLLRPRYLGRSGRPLWLQGMRAEVRREPHGVVLIIGPSNYPLFLPGVQTVQALAAGNAVLLKPGARGGPIARRFAELLYAAGLDNRLLQVLPEEPESARHAIACGVDSRYRIFERLGVFGIEIGTLRGARDFLRTSCAILARPQTALWITTQGRFADVRERPPGVLPGVAHLARRLQGAVILPLALEYPFWEERYPEVLARFGRPIVVGPRADRSVEEWRTCIEEALADTQDALASAAQRRDPAAFDTLVGGKAGIGGIYDWWRWLKACLFGRPFRAEHGEKGVLPAPGGPR